MSTNRTSDSATLFLSGNLPIYIFPIQENTHVYEAWIGYSYLGVATSYKQTNSNTLDSDGKPSSILIELGFDWGTVAADSRYLRQLKSLGKFRKEQGKQVPVFTLLTNNNGGYLLAGNSVLANYDFMTHNFDKVPQITVNCSHLQVRSIT